MYALLAREIMNALGEKGKRIVREATRRYGKDRGRTRREKHEALGVKLICIVCLPYAVICRQIRDFARDRLKLTDEEQKFHIHLFARWQKFGINMMQEE